MKKFYLAYGSNLNVKQMQFRCPDARIVGTAEIPNYQLLFKGSKTGSYLTIEPKRAVPFRRQSGRCRNEMNLPSTAMRGIPISTTKRNWNFLLQKPEKS